MSVEAPERSATHEGASSKVVIGLIIAAVGMVVLYFALGMPGMDHGGTTSAPHDMAAMESTDVTARSASVEQFDIAADEPGAFVVNVHVPYDGEIARTDAFIPYDSIGTSEDVPTELGRPVLVYCRDGSMSQLAADALVARGYTNVAYLDGGMEAWTASGRALRHDPDRAA